MFNAIAAGVVGVAMAAGSLGGLPVTEIGDEGWFEGGDRNHTTTLPGTRSSSPARTASRWS